MKMALKDGQVLVIEADNVQFQIIKSWSRMRWNRSERMFYGPADADLLNRLAGLVRLPAPIEAERRRLNAVAEAVDRERIAADPEPLYKYPVRYPLYKHQTRAANMALLVFGLVPPPDQSKKEDIT